MTSYILADLVISGAESGRMGAPHMTTVAFPAADHQTIYSCQLPASASIVTSNSTRIDMFAASRTSHHGMRRAASRVTQLASAASPRTCRACERTSPTAARRPIASTSSRQQQQQHRDQGRGGRIYYQGRQPPGWPQGKSGSGSGHGTPPTFDNTTLAVGAIMMAAAGFYAWNMQKVPLTGRWRFNYLSDEVAAWWHPRAAEEILEELNKQGVRCLPESDWRTKIVREVMRRLIPVSGLSDLKWELFVIDDDGKCPLPSTMYIYIILGEPMLTGSFLRHRQCLCPPRRQGIRAQRHPPRLRQLVRPGYCTGPRDCTPGGLARPRAAVAGVGGQHDAGLALLPGRVAAGTGFVCPLGRGGRIHCARDSILAAHEPDARARGGPHRADDDGRGVLRSRGGDSVLAAHGGAGATGGRRPGGAGDGEHASNSTFSFTKCL